MIGKNKNKIEDNIKSPENNFGKNNLADVSRDIKHVQPDEDHAWSRWVEGGITLLNHDLEEIQSGEIIAKNRELSLAERNSFWQELESLTSQETKAENIDTVLSVERRGELIKQELLSTIEQQEAECSRLEKEEVLLDNRWKKIDSRDWPNYIPVANVIYQAMNKTKKKEIHNKSREIDREVDKLKYRIEKNKELVKKVDDFYAKNTPDWLFYCKAKKEIGETMDNVVKTIDDKYGKKIGEENKIFWDLTRLNFKKEVFVDIGNTLLNKPWEDKYRIQLELLLKEKEAELNKEKIIRDAKGSLFDTYQYEPDPADWKYRTRTFLEKYDQYRNSVIGEWDWNKYKQVFSHSEKLNRINNILEDKLIDNLLKDVRENMTSAPEMIIKIGKLPDIISKTHIQIKQNAFLDNSIDGYINFLRKIKKSPNFNFSLLEKIPLTDEQEKQNFDHDLKLTESVNNNDKAGLVLKLGEEDKFSTEDKELLKIYFNPDSMFNKLLANLNEAEKEDAQEDFFKMGYKFIKRQEEYSKELLEKKLITWESLKRFYFIDNIKDIHGIAEYVFGLADNLEKGEKIWEDYKDDLIKKAVVGEGTKKAWDIIFSKTKLNKKEIWNLFAPTLENYATPSIYPLLLMAKDGYLDEKEIVGKFGERIISGLRWSNVCGVIQKIDGIKDTNREELQNLYSKLFDYLRDWKMFLPFSQQINELNNLIAITKVDKNKIYQQYLAVLITQLLRTEDDLRVDNAKLLASNSNLDLEAILYQSLIRIGDDQKLKNNKLIDFLEQNENKKYLEDFIGRLAYLTDNQNIQEITDEQRKNIQHFLGQIKPKNKQEIIEQIVTLSRLKKGKELFRIMIDNAKIEKNFLPGMLGSIVNLVKMEERLFLGELGLNIKKPSWQNILNYFNKQIKEKLTDKNYSYQFIGYANRAQYQDVFGKEVITDLLNSLTPTADSQYSSEKRNALTHNKFDHFSEWLKYYNQRCDLTLNETNFKIAGDFIRSNGLTRNELLFSCYRDLWLKENNKADVGALERIKSWGIETLADLKKAVENIMKNLVADKFDLDLKILTNFEKALLDSQLGISRHTHNGTKDLNRLIATYLYDKEEIDKTSLPPEYKIWEMEVKNLGSSFDYPDQERQEYQKIVDQIRNYRNNDWQELTKKLAAQDFGNKEDETIKWLLINQDSLVNDKAKKCRQIFKAIIWQKIFKRDLATDENQKDWLKEISNPAQIETLQTFLTTNILEHGIAGHANSLEEIWGKELADIIKQEKTKEWLTNLFTEEQGQIDKLNSSWQNSRRASGVTKIKVVPGRDFIGSLSAYIANACYSKEESFMKRYNGETLPLVIPYRLTQGEEIIGSVLLFELKEDKALLVRALNIPEEKNYDMTEVVEKFIDQIAEIAKTKGFDKVIVPAGNHHAVSNYANVIGIIGAYAKDENKIELKQEFDFNGYPLKNVCYVARRIEL